MIRRACVVPRASHSRIALKGRKNKEKRRNGSQNGKKRKTRTQILNENDIRRGKEKKRIRLPFIIVGICIKSKKRNERPLWTKKGEEIWTIVCYLDNRERCFFYILLVYTFTAAMLILFKDLRLIGWVSRWSAGRPAIFRLRDHPRSPWSWTKIFYFRRVARNFI